jgi:hypothetical protein
LFLPHLPQFLFFLQNRKCTETPLHVEVYEIIFPTSHQNLLRRCNLSKADFRLCNAQWFSHISLYGSSKLMILDVLEKKVWRSFWILNFLLLYVSEHVLKSWCKHQLPSQAL